MEELFDSLKNWGCDVDGALARFIGDRELYRSCLHTAAGDQNFELLPEALRAGEMGRAFECAHTLKGMLANMGLIPLYDIVVRIVEPLRAGEDHRQTSVRTGDSGRTGDDPEGSGQSVGNLTILYFPTGEKDHAAAEKGDQPAYLTLHSGRIHDTI